MQIEGTKLNYPVMYTPKEPDYYLHRAFDKSESISGTPFIGKGCTLNPRSKNVVIYSHNMKNGSMFKTLLSYNEKKFWEEHPVIRFDTLYEEAEYVIIAAFYIDVTPENGHFQFYNFLNFDTREEQEVFVEACKTQSLYETEVNIESETNFVTLVTCSYHSLNGRFVIVAKKK
nr:class B sortase [uncultured Lachnoclostridium sp.]